VNPERVRCGIFDIIGAHISNFKYMTKVADFDYFTFAASNKLYCKSGRDNLLNGQSALCYHRKNDIEKSTWSQIKGIDEDNYFYEIFPEQIGNKYLYCGFCEGTSYRKDIFNIIVEMIEEKYVHEDVKIGYAREELYFPLALQKISSNDIVHKQTTYMPWDLNFVTTCVDVCDIIEGQNDFFSIKRVELELYTSIRAFIRQFVGKYQDELKAVIGKDLKTCSIEEISEKDAAAKREQEKYKLRYERLIRNGHTFWYYVD